MKNMSNTELDARHFQQYEPQESWYNPMKSLGSLQITNHATLTYNQNGVFVQNMPNGPDQPDMQHIVQPGVVDHYYYPDSDLETIMEESSVLDSEDESVDRSIRAFPTSSTSTNASDSDNTTRGSGSECPSPVIGLPGKPSNFFKPVDSVNQCQPSSNSLISPNVINLNTSPRNQQPQESYYIPQPKPEPPSIGAQKIIYAKCLSPKADRQGWPTEPLVITNEKSTISSMFEAAKSGEVFALNSFSASELNDTLDENGNTALHVAAEHGHLKCVRRLVSTASPHMITLPNDDLMTPTAMAVMNGHTPCVQWLVKCTAAREELSVSNKTSSFDGSTTRPPLAHIAAKFNRSEILDWLCEEMKAEGYTVDTADHASNTAVHFAAQYGHMECIQTLVARGASVTLMNSDGDTPCQAAQKKGHDCCVGYLVVVETCVSLAQQVVALRNDVETLKTENQKLIGEMEVIKSPNHRTKENLFEKQIISNGIDQNSASQNPSHQHIVHDTRDTDRIKDNSSFEKQLPQIDKPQKRFLQEQPPPPKMWNKKNHNQSKGPVTSNEANGSVNTAEYQRRINAALNGPGTSLGKDSLSNNHQAPAAPKLNGLHKETSSSSDSEQANREVKMLTENEVPKNKAWQKLSMDEMLKRVRDVRYLPSPTISHCTEDSTMETVEVMRERLAAASRWFLVEQARNGGGRPRAPAPKHLHQKKSNANKFNPNRSDTKGSGKHPGMSNSTAKWVLESQPEQNNASKMQNEQQIVQMNHSPIKPNPIRKTSDHNSATANIQTKTSVPTGTLKFMVSHAKAAKKNNISKMNLPKTPEKKSSPVFSSPKSSLSHTPTDTPPSTPTSSSTQRTGSYRRAINKQPKAVNESRSSPDSLSSSSTSVEGTTRSTSSEDRSSKSSKSRSKSHARNEPLLGNQTINFHGMEDPLKKKTSPVNNIMRTPSVQLQQQPTGRQIHHFPYTGPTTHNQQINDKPSPFISEYRKVEFAPHKTSQVASQSYVEKSSNSELSVDRNVNGSYTTLPNHPAKQVSFFRRVHGKLR
ncbi:uncharacterized protein LOC100185205 [Ciona intestinalis]